MPLQCACARCLGHSKGGQRQRSLSLRCWLPWLLQRPRRPRWLHSVAAMSRCAPTI